MIVHQPSSSLGSSASAGAPKLKSHLPKSSSQIQSPKRRLQKSRSRLWVATSMPLNAYQGSVISTNPRTYTPLFLITTILCWLTIILRIKLSINNSCDLILGGENGDAMYLVSRSRNQFFSMREMFLGSMIWFQVAVLVG